MSNTPPHTLDERIPPTWKPQRHCASTPQTSSPKSTQNFGERDKHTSSPHRKGPTPIDWFNNFVQSVHNNAWKRARLQYQKRVHTTTPSHNTVRSSPLSQEMADVLFQFNITSPTQLTNIITHTSTTQATTKKLQRKLQKQNVLIHNLEYELEVATTSPNNTNPITPPFLQASHEAFTTITTLTKELEAAHNIIDAMQQQIEELQHPTTTPDSTTSTSPFLSHTTSTSSSLHDESQEEYDELLEDYNELFNKLDEAIDKLDHLEDALLCSCTSSFPLHEFFHTPPSPPTITQNPQKKHQAL